MLCAFLQHSLKGRWLQLYYVTYSLHFCAKFVLFQLSDVILILWSIIRSEKRTNCEFNDVKIELFLKILLTENLEMTDKDYAPLSAVCVRTLSDKVYEKRKAAAFEIEK